MQRYYIVIREERAPKAASPDIELTLGNLDLVTVNSPDVSDAQEVCRRLIKETGGTWLIFRLQHICTPDMDVSSATVP
ncbi:MAG: hypothetical protein GY906_03755 [bacterium]|nr:hypothetical protein [bacterium]